MKFWFDTLKSRLLLTLVTGVLFTRDGLSFDALGKVEVSAPVIFTTAYDEYAVRAFKYNGIDYLLKPVDADELASAVARAVKMRTSATDDNLRLLLEQMQRSSFRYRERFLLPWRDGYKSVLVRDISHVRAVLCRNSIIAEGGPNVRAAFFLSTVSAVYGAVSMP